MQARMRETGAGPFVRADGTGGGRSGRAGVGGRGLDLTRGDGAIRETVEGHRSPHLWSNGMALG